MATPDPFPLRGLFFNQSGRLRVMNDYVISFKGMASGIFSVDLYIILEQPLRNVLFLTLEGIVKSLGSSEKLFRSRNDLPPGIHADVLQ
jgi:hypothetical protein